MKVRVDEEEPSAGGGACFSPAAVMRFLFWCIRQVRRDLSSRRRLSASFLKALSTEATSFLRDCLYLFATPPRRSGPWRSRSLRIFPGGQCLPRRRGP